MKTLKYDCPCTQDCPNRVVGCRSNCEPFQEYERRRMEGYEEAARKRAAYEFSFEGRVKGRDKFWKKQNRLKPRRRGRQARFG